MPRTLTAAIILITGILAFSSCNSVPDRSWEYAIPEKAPFVVIPSADANLNTVLDAPYFPFLDDVTASALSLASEIDTTGVGTVAVEGIILYPATGSELQPVWATRASGDVLQKLKPVFYEDFTQNEYSFNGTVIHKLHIRDRSLFAAQFYDLLLLSESSLALEASVRAYRGLQPPADLSGLQLKPGSLVLNTPSLDKWAEQLAKIIYRPAIKDAFSGTKPAVLSLTETEQEEQRHLSFTGTIPLAQTGRSDLVSAVSEANAPVGLDRYISSNAAAFGIFRLSPRLAPPVSVPDTSALDKELMTDKVRYGAIARSLDAPFALVLYAESGFLSTGEHLFLRKLSEVSAFRNEMNVLVSRDLARYSDGTYYIQSKVLAQLIGSELSTFSDFYLDITGDVAVISKRKGLAEIVASDRSRRRVIYYEQQYMDLRERFPDEVSGLFIVNREFNSFITPFLAPGHYMDVLTSRFDMLGITTRLNPAGDALAFDMTTLTTEEDTGPYREQWLFPIGNAELSGPPVLADIGGSPRDEVIFATKSGSVYALAGDGTVVMQVNTGEDVPVGSPVVYDWYATNQNVILLAAGNKIYGWNDTGELLPKFPFELDEAITSPVTVGDIDRDGLPEAVAATANRRLHALDGRGNNLAGWPLTTNSVIRTKPLIDYFQGAYSVMAFSENGVHAWYPDGVPRNGFPKFVNASLSGSPVIYDGNILAGGADGYLYSIGNRPLFADSLNVYSTTSDSTGIRAVYVSNSALNGEPSVRQVTVRAPESEQTYSGEMILVMSSNGSVFLMEPSGELRFTQSMGQPAANGFSPFITDLDSDNRQDVVALAGFGRLYAWQLLGGERIYSLPTTGMSNIAVTDLDGDGYMEVIAKTREGLRCWTIFGEQEED